MIPCARAAWQADREGTPTALTALLEKDTVLQRVLGALWDKGGREMSKG